MIKIHKGVEYTLIPLPGFYNYYISIEGQILSTKRGVPKLLKSHLSVTGYLAYSLIVKTKLKTLPVHRLVGFAFVVNPNNKEYINHKDGNKTNNHKDNLEWVTPSENILHAYKTGLKTNRGDKHPRKKLTSKDVIFLREWNLLAPRTYKDWSDVFDVCPTTISKAIRGLTWSHI